MDKAAGGRPAVQATQNARSSLGLEPWNTYRARKRPNWVRKWVFRWPTMPRSGRNGRSSVTAPTPPSSYGNHRMIIMMRECMEAFPHGGMWHMTMYAAETLNAIVKTCDKGFIAFLEVNSNLTACV